MNIGLDFGTTNSVISYYNKENKSLDCFRKQAGDNSYIPTFIAYGKRGIEIGEEAKSNVGNSKANVYSNFKLLLGSAFDKVIPSKEKTPHEVTKDYIGNLLSQFQKEGHTYEKIVMTIPEAWYREDTNFMARENIQALYKELGIENVCFQSEPVAAAAYFCWKYQYQQPEENIEHKPYDGKIIVIDYGGGTLDVTLCEVKNGNKIRVLDSCGFGEDKGKGGCAGSAFDEEVIKILEQEYNLSLEEREFIIAKNEFENKLIARSKTCTEIMKDYFVYPEGVEEDTILTLNFIGGKNVYSKHLKQAFDNVNKRVLEDAINQIKKSNEFELERTKIIMVGGFSNFCCVEELTRRLFGSRMDAQDIRFPTLLSQDNRALAIAKGAALIADGVISVDPVFPYELGIIVGELEEEQHQVHDRYIPLISKGELIEKYDKPVYSQIRVEANMYGADFFCLRMYIGEKEDNRKIFALDNSIREVFPEDRERRYQVGIRVDFNMIPELCIKGKNGNETRTSLNRVLEKLSIQRIVEK